VQVRVLLSRPSHQADGYSLRGNAVRAYTPHNPVPRDELWYFFLTEPSSNAVLAYTKVRGGARNNSTPACLLISFCAFLCIPAAIPIADVAKCVTHQNFTLAALRHLSLLAAGVFSCTCR
jgi:hypothetical protein